jgi:hypothetical protein
MGMRWSAPVLALTFLLAGSWQLSAASHADGCHYDAVDGRLVCTSSGASTGPSRSTPPRVRPPNRYVYESTDATGAACHYWSTVPGGIDAWETANDPIVIVIVTTTPVCPLLVETPAEIAWRIFRAFPLAIPDPSFEPPGSGITGLSTYVATADPADITHVEVLPDGRTMEVWASVASLTVDWGDGSEGTFEPVEALGYPSGGVTHTYRTKTCDAAYREQHPSGGNCHPTLEAYPVTASFVWAGRYRIGGSWIDLGTLSRTATVAYDVDEVQGVLQP